MQKYNLARNKVKSPKIKREFVKKNIRSTFSPQIDYDKWFEMSERLDEDVTRQAQLKDL